MGFLIGFFLEASIGMIGFWFLRGQHRCCLSLMLFSFFLSGHMFPLDDVAPESVESVVQFLAVQVLGILSGGNLSGQRFRKTRLCRSRSAIEAAWLTVLYRPLSMWHLRRGVKRYSGFGG